VNEILIIVVLRQEQNEEVHMKLISASGGSHLPYLVFISTSVGSNDLLALCMLYEILGSHWSLLV
jgi:hypothetical protein